MIDDRNSSPIDIVISDLLDISDEDVLAAVIEAGEDPELMAEEVRERLRQFASREKHIFAETFNQAQSQGTSAGDTRFQEVVNQFVLFVKGHQDLSTKPRLSRNSIWPSVWHYLFGMEKLVYAVTVAAITIGVPSALYLLYHSPNNSESVAKLDEPEVERPRDSQSDQAPAVVAAAPLDSQSVREPMIAGPGETSVVAAPAVVAPIPTPASAPSHAPSHAPAPVPMPIPSAIFPSSTRVKNVIMVTIKSDGTLALNESPVARDALTTAFAGVADTFIYLMVQKEAPHGEVLEVVKLLHEAGWEISLHILDCA